MANRAAGNWQDDWLTRLIQAWVEHEQKILYRQSQLSWAGENYVWYLDKNLEQIGCGDPWRPEAYLRGKPTMAAACNPPQITFFKERPHTLLDEFGCLLRAMAFIPQCLVVIRAMEEYEILTSIRIVETEEQWQTLMKYLLQLSGSKEALSKTTDDCWLALKLAWTLRRKQYRSARSIV